MTEASSDPTQTTPSVAPGLRRRQLLPWLGAAGLAAANPSAFAGMMERSDHPRPPPAMARYVYVATYTAPAVPPGGTHPSAAQGIYVFRMDPRHGGLTLLQVVMASNPSYLALNSSATRLYSVNENTAGTVSAYAVDPATGKLSFINSASANGRDTTHLVVHPSGQFLMAANYSSGNWPIFRLAADGSIGAKTADFQGVGNGTGANPARQEAPHAHQIIADLDAQHVFAVDLGADKVNVLNLDLGTGALTANGVPFANAASGSGPRHMAFHPNRQRAYVLHELTSTIDVCSYDPVRGALVWLQTISTLPRDFVGANTTAEIRIHPGGRFLYNTNRGHNSIAKFAIDEGDGSLDSLGWESTGGQWPRGMNIDPSGTFLYAANQNTDNIVVFEVGRDGDLRRTGAVVNTPTPVDVEFGAPV
jgi:6-phosphogluconolactonase